ncbi:hypothetical protein DOY81_007542 [Sarcophaga bullata]|nr:hypothetical protein DOY81_007542 [Sarcophaga bullata]
MLKILLASLTGLVTANTQYDYGYHPSAEEFDNLLRETRRTWTYNFIKSDRDHLLNKPITAYNTNNLQNWKPLKTEARYFVPKFQYENEMKKFHTVSFNPHADQNLAASNKRPQVPLKNVGSTLDFNYYSDELPQPIFNTPTSTYRPPEHYAGTSPSLPDINLKPINKPHILNPKNSSHDHFPIYFTNPATGIVYAITEVGKTEENFTATNGSIPIFITKEQYERDIKHLKQAYEQKCPQIYTTPRPQIIRILKKPAVTSVLPINSTKFAPPPSLKKPSPVVEKTELTVKDKAVTSTLRPLRKKKKKTKAKRKLKKRNPPGHKRTTLRPILANQANGPVIIMGTRSSTTKKPLINIEKLSTQLEKPNFDIFSSATAPHSQQHKVKKRSPPESYKTSNISKRLKDNSSEILRGFFESNSSNEVDKDGVLKILNKNSTQEINPESLIESVFKTLKSREDRKNLIDNLENISPNDLLSPTLTEHEHHVHKRSLNISEPKFIKKSNTIAHQLDLKNSSSVNINQREQERSISVSEKNNRGSVNITEPNVLKNSKLNSKLPTPANGLRKRKRNSKIKSNSAPTNSNSSQTYSIPKGLTTTPRTIKKSGKTRKKHKNLAKKSNREKADEEYYFFSDYDDNEEEDEDEDEDYEDDDDDDDDDDDVDDNEDKEQEIVNRNDILAYEDDDNDTPTLPTSELSVSLEDLTEKPVIKHIKNAYEEEDNDSSAVQIEQIKFKAPAPAILDYDMLNRLKLKSQSSPSALYKKRIRRRPQLKIDRDDYDYDDEEDSNGIGSSLGGFFRMIFYPIQVVMSSVMDSLAGGKDTDDEEDNSLASNPYTQYTSYHNTLKQQSTDDYDEDYDSNESSASSLSSWFSSWFGLNRRNKKISSTTVAPLQPKPTKTSSSWLYSWLGFGNNDRISTESQSTETDDEYDKWFASWFGETKPKARKRTTTTTTTTQLPHVPILTIVDPMKNPQNWIGILAHHIINHTATSTVNPLKDMWSKVTTTTTENPEIPRKINYEKYQIWRLKPQDDSQVKALEEYKKSEDGIKLQWLKGPSLRGLTDVLVPPKMLVDFQASLTFELIDHEVLIFDVGKAIAYEKTKEDYFFTTTQKPKKHQNKIPSAAITAGITWRRYYEYDDIIKYLETMRMRFPHLVELIHIGRSYEGRPLIVMKIESKEAAAVNSAHYPAHQRNKLRHRKRIGLANAVFIEAGTHGMEWIGPATATWIINELLRIMKSEY